MDKLFGLKHQTLTLSKKLEEEQLHGVCFAGVIFAITPRNNALFFNQGSRQYFRINKSLESDLFGLHTVDNNFHPGF